MRILFLTHRLPYAPNRGDRVRAYHELRALASARHEVHLLSLVHDNEEAAHAQDLRGLCASVRVALVPRRKNLVRSIPTLISGRPLTHTLLDSPDMRPALHALAGSSRPDLVLAYCSSMARFAVESPLAGIPFILDMVDVDSAKWRELAKTAKFPLNWVYTREAWVLGSFEAGVTRRAIVTYVVTDREAQTLRNLAGPDPRIEVLENGVDIERLRPPYPPGQSDDVVFCGVMNYSPNEEGAVWLAEKVWPTVRAAKPNARLLLVGTAPTSRLLALAKRDESVVVTGSVPDVRPFLWQGAVAAAPLLVARGIQNKVLEAVGAGLPAVVTPVVAAGLPAEVISACRVAASPSEFASHLIETLSCPPATRRAMASLASLDGMKWETRLAPLLEAIDRAATAPSSEQRTHEPLDGNERCERERFS